MDEKDFIKLWKYEQYNLPKMWFEGQTDPSMDTILEQPANPDPVSNLHNSSRQFQSSSSTGNIEQMQHHDKDPVELSSIPTVNKGADQTSSPIIQVYKGDDLPTIDQASEEDSDTNSLLMPEMVNLEASGLRCSNRIASQGKTSYNFFSGI